MAKQVLLVERQVDRRLLRVGRRVPGVDNRSNMSVQMSTASRRKEVRVSKQVIP